MKRFIFAILAVLTSAVQAQTFMKVYTKGSTEPLIINTADIDSITFEREAEKGTIKNPFTVAELLEACNGLGANEFLNDGAEVYARGIITRVTEMNTQYGNATYYIADKRNSKEEFCVYRGRLLNQAWVKTGDELSMGDTVTVCGKVKNFNGKTLEFDNNNYLVELRKYQPSYEERNAVFRLEMPRLKEGDNQLLLVHTATLNDLTGETGINYSTEWDTSIHAQRWSCYQLYASLLEKNTDRTQTGYPNDPFLPMTYQFAADPYVRSGYDHGHICPSADRLASVESNEQTFYMTNMQPQTHSLNAGIWSRMETQVRSWAASAYIDTLYVVKGGTIDKEDQIYDYLGSDANQIPVPKYFFMAMLAKQSTGGYTAIGLWVEHIAEYSSKTPIGNFAVNIRELEQKTGIDFFPNLPDAIEESVETLPLSNLKNVWGL